MRGAHDLMRFFEYVILLNNNVRSILTNALLSDCYVSVAGDYILAGKMPVDKDQKVVAVSESRRKERKKKEIGEDKNKEQ